MAGLDIKLDDNFLDVAAAFEELNTNQLVSATRRALNRTLLTLRKTSIEEITKRVKIKPKSLRDRYIMLQKAGGGALNSLEAALVFSGEPVPLLEFVKGSKQPIEQKGIPVKRRKKLRAEITPGKRFVVKGAFIQRVRSLQVFKRKDSGGFHKQGTRSIAFIITERGVGEKLVSVGQTRLAELLQHELEFQLLKMQGKIPERF